MGVAGPHVDLLFEPAGVVEACRSEGDELRGGVGFDVRGRAAFRAKTAVSLAASFTGGRIKAGLALQQLECFRRHDDVRRKRTAAGPLTIATMAVKHDYRRHSGFVANRATSTSAGEGCF